MRSAPRVSAMKPLEIFFSMVLLIFGIFGMLFPVLATKTPPEAKHAPGFAMSAATIPANSAVVCYAGYATGFEGPVAQLHYISGSEQTARSVVRWGMPSWIGKAFKTVRFTEKELLEVGDYDLCVFGRAL